MNFFFETFEKEIEKALAPTATGRQQEEYLGGADPACGIGGYMKIVLATFFQAFLEERIF